jgi:DNA modification methylase
MRTNVIWRGDCMKILSDGGDFPSESVDLVYMDPPFFTQRNYEVVWGDKAEVRSFEDRWAGGVENYISWLEPRIRALHRVLKPTGTIYVHCDWHANAHIRILLDHIFGESNFRNEIAWCYSGGGLPRKDFPRKHDTILRCVKDAKAYEEAGTFNVEYRPYSKKVSGIHSNGEKLPMERGTPITDWWADLPFVNPWSKSGDVKLGYPTQKPIALLERIIRISSRPQDVVLDPFCGCGTAIAAAARLGRQWIGIDVSPKACGVMRQRMTSLEVPNVEILGAPSTMQEWHELQPFDFQRWVLRQLGGRMTERKTGDMGIDGWLADGTPIQVKQQEHVGRNTVDNFETALRREKKSVGMIVAFSFGKGAIEEAARVRNLPNGNRMDIILRTMDALTEAD